MSDLIYNQRKIPKDKWRYGLRSSAATGCGWIATYNALHLMGHEVQPQQIIRWYERHVPVINGNFGTFLPSLAGYFKHKGYRVKIVRKMEQFDQTAAESDACILFYYWRNQIKLGAHYVAVKQENGIFRGYNTYSNSVRADNYGNSLQAFLKRKKYFFCVLICLKKPIGE